MHLKPLRFKGLENYSNHVFIHGFFYYICKMITGIYKILNTVNNKVYIGSAVDIKKRWRDHKWYLKKNMHHNSHLQFAYNKYGLIKFQFIIEQECPIENLLINEEKYIKKYNSKNKRFGYNVNDPREIQFGVKCRNDIKLILSNRMVGENNPMYGKTGEQHPKYKYCLSKEKRKKLSEWAKNRRGNESNASKLNESRVNEIRNLYKNKKHTQNELSKIYDVTQVTISDIVLRKTWTHI